MKIRNEDEKWKSKIKCKWKSKWKVKTKNVKKKNIIKNSEWKVEIK